jgi:ABC-type transport system involved in multi-copper enzyme maturation permease subunit
MYVIILSIELALIAIILIAGIIIGGKKKETIEVTTE